MKFDFDLGDHGDFMSGFHLYKSVESENMDSVLNEMIIEKLIKTIIFMFSDLSLLENNKFRRLVNSTSKSYTIEKVFDNNIKKRKINPLRFYIYIIDSIKNESLPVEEVGTILDKIVKSNYNASVSGLINDTEIYSSFEKLSGSHRAIASYIKRYLNDSDIGDAKKFNENTLAFIDELEKIIEKVTTTKLTHFNNIYEKLYTKIDIVLDALSGVSSEAEVINISLNDIDYAKARSLISKKYAIAQNMITEKIVDNILTRVIILENKFLLIEHDRATVDYPALEGIPSAPQRPMTPEDEMFFQSLKEIVITNNTKVVEIIDRIKTIFLSTSEKEMKIIIEEVKNLNVKYLIRSSLTDFNAVGAKMEENEKLIEKFVEHVTQLRNSMKKYLTHDIMSRDLNMSLMSARENKSKMNVVYNNLVSLTKAEDIHRTIFKNVGVIFRNVDEVNDKLSNVITEKIKSVSKSAMKRAGKGFITSVNIIKDFLSEDQIFADTLDIAKSVTKAGKGVTDKVFDVSIAGNIDIADKGFHSTKLNTIKNMDSIGEANIDRLKELTDDESIQEIIPKDISLKASVNTSVLNFRGKRNFEIGEYELPFLRSIKTVDRFKNQDVYFYASGIKGDKFLDIVDNDLIVGKTLLVCKVMKTQTVGKRVFVVLKYRSKMFRVPINTFRLITPMDIALMPKILSTRTSVRMFLGKNIVRGSFGYLRKWTKLNYDAPVINSVKGLSVYVNKVITSLNNMNKLSIDYDNELVRIVDNNNNEGE